jgi:C4-dicarboxylate transporter
MSAPTLDRPSPPGLSHDHRPLPAWAPWVLAAVALVLALALRAVLGSGPVLTAVLAALVFGVLVNLARGASRGAGAPPTAPSPPS